MWAFRCPTPLLDHTKAFLIPSIQILRHRRTYNWTHFGKLQRHWEDISCGLAVVQIRLHTGKLRSQRKGEKVPWWNWRTVAIRWPSLTATKLRVKNSRWFLIMNVWQGAMFPMQSNLFMIMMPNVGQLLERIWSLHAVQSEGNGILHHQRAWHESWMLPSGTKKGKGRSIPCSVCLHLAWVWCCGFLPLKLIQY